METYSFTSLSFSDAGGYTCQATVMSNLVSGPITTTSSNSVNVTLTCELLFFFNLSPWHSWLCCHMYCVFFAIVPTPVAAVTSNPTGIITVGSSVTLTCTVELSASVDVPVTVNTVWTGPDNFNRNIMAQQMGSTTTYTSTAMVSSFGRDQSGDYTCTATVSSTAQFIITSISESSSVKITSCKLIKHCDTIFYCSLFLTVPRPTVYLISSSTNPVVSGSLVTLTCTVEFHQPVGVPLTINTVWTGPVGLAITGPAVMESLTLYQSSVTTKLNLSGKYTCTANVSGAFEVSASTSIEIGKANEHTIIRDIVAMS